jgi:glycosyltransferase involved in cell wall biosynthesis
MDEVSQQVEVSVVIPTHNRCRLLQRTLSSVLAQTQVRFEVIVVDDGSSDSTPQFLLSLEDPRVVVLRHETPRGVSAARNAGLGIARGKWAAFTDDDDLWAPDKLRAQLDAAQHIPDAGWVTVGEVMVNNALSIIAGRRPPHSAEMRNVLRYNVVPGGGSGTMIRTDLLRGMGGFSTDLTVLADWDLWIRLYLAAPAAFVRRPLVAYRRHPASMSHGTELIERELAAIVSRYAADRALHGASFLYTVWLQWVARMQLQAHKRAAAAHTALGMCRYWREWPAFTLVAILSIPRRRGLYRWRRQGERWLAPIRDLESPPASWVTYASQPLLCGLADEAAAQESQ